MNCCLYGEPGPKKQDYKYRFRTRCLFSLRAASQIFEILYLVDFVYKLRMPSALESLIWLIPSVYFPTCCGSLSSLFKSEQVLPIVISSISFAKKCNIGLLNKPKQRKSSHRKAAKLLKTLCILPKMSTPIIVKANWFDLVVLKLHILILEYFRWCCSQRRRPNLTRTSQAYFFIPDQSVKRSFEMRFCSKTVFLIKLTLYIYRSQLFLKLSETISIFKDNLNFLFKS